MAGQSLAPASLHFKVVARAARFLAEDIEGAIYVPTAEDLIMKPPIGLDTNIEILLSLKRLDPSNPSWSFSITTKAKGTLRSSSPFEHSTERVHLTKRDNAQAAQIFYRFETLTGFRRYEEMMNHPDGEEVGEARLSRLQSYRALWRELPRHQGTLVRWLRSRCFMQFAGFLVKYFNSPSLENVLVCSKIEPIEIGGGFDPDAKGWVVYSNMTQRGDTVASSDAYVFDAKSRKMALLARMWKSVDKGSASAEKTEKPVTAERAAESSIPQANMPTKKSSKREEHLKILARGHRRAA
ncbi:MAG: hypothetical protein M1816_003896 [Peltula sp. TS41687]|nr:MAG: hypothetical protein M1816_003896 [Peltula sp. TS41687]